MTARKSKYTGPEVTLWENGVTYVGNEFVLVGGMRAWRKDLPELIRRLQAFVPEDQYEVEVRGNIASYTPKHKAKAKEWHFPDCAPDCPGPNPPGAPHKRVPSKPKRKRVKRG